jgi:hypothetical protein
MSVRAYRINEIKTESTDSFNLWHDTYIYDKFSACGCFETLNEGGGIFEISEEDLKEVIQDIKKDKEQKVIYKDVIKSLEKDLKWAKDKDESYIQYYCY